MSVVGVDWPSKQVISSPRIHRQLISDLGER
jgi:hypothetical protein